MTIKEQAISLIQQLPEDATIEDAVDKLLFLNKINSGIKDIENGNIHSHEDAKRKFNI